MSTPHPDSVARSARPKGIARAIRFGSLAPLTASATVCLLIAVADGLTGAELGLGSFYLGPVAWVAWRRPGPLAQVFGLLATSCCLVADVCGHSDFPRRMLAWSAVHHLVFFSTVAFLVSRLASRHHEAMQGARHDPLTGLLNRRGFEELAAREVRRALRSRRPLSFVLLDLNEFKRVNDTLGHAEGDAVLRVVAEELSGLRATDIVVRLGGDEFGVLMPETDAANAERFTRRLRDRIHARMKVEGWPVTLSVGVVSEAMDLPKMLCEADRLMYGAKRDSSTHQQTEASRSSR